MRIGAKIMLNTGMDAACDGLAGLVGGSWMMSLPQKQEAYCGHPAGRARRGLPASGGGPGLVAVTFGMLPEPAGSRMLLPVRWESVEPGDEFAVLLDGDVTLAPDAGQAHSTLTLAGFCRLLPATLTDGGYEQARLQVIEAARAFITSVAVTVARSADPGQEQEPPGPAWSWLTGQPGTA